MDLPTCPSCGQSVLDDDAQDCPFCGSSMKAGGTPSRPPAAKPAPRKRPAPAPAAKEPEAVAPSAPAKKKPVVDEDPFAVDQSESAKAIQSSPRPGQGRSLEVTCPMCESTGYVSPKAAGHQVRCSNPKCLVPVFTAPAIEKKEAPPPPPPKPRTGTYLFVGASLLLVGLVGGGGYWYIKQMSAPTKIAAPNLKIFDKQPGTAVETDDPDENGDSTNPQPVAPVAPTISPEQRLANLKNQILTEVVDAARKAPGTRKPYSRRLAALTYIAAGDLAGAREQLNQLEKFGRGNMYEVVLPQLELAWKQLAANDQAGFQQSVDKAAKLADQLPSRGRYAVESSIHLAAALTLLNRTDEARKLIAGRRTVLLNDNLAAALVVARAGQTFDFDVPVGARTLEYWNAPMTTAVTLLLGAQNRWDDSHTWAKGVSDTEARLESLVAWGEELGRQQRQAGGMDRALEAAAQWPPAAKARLQARLAAVQLAAKDRAAAEALAGDAAATLKGITLPPAVTIDGIKTLLKMKTPDVVPLEQAALAATDLAHAQWELQQPDAAWESLQLATQFLRASAPSVAVVQQHLNAVENNSVELTRLELKSALDLSSDDQVRRAFTQYKQRSRQLLDVANRRFHLQVAIYRQAAQWGLLDPLWEELQARNSAADVNDRQPFLTTSLPLLIADRYAVSGKTDQATSVRDAVQEMSATDQQAHTEDETLFLVTDGQVAEAVQKLNDGINDQGALQEWTLRLACRLVDKGDLQQAVVLLDGLKEVLLKEEGLRLAAALAARQGKAEQFRTIARDKAPAPTELISVSTGLMEGLSQPAPAPKPAAPGTGAAATKPAPPAAK